MIHHYLCIVLFFGAFYSGGSLCLLTFLTGTLGYSAWWHWQRNEALRAGRDPDEWFSDFDQNHDPVSQKLREWGFSK
jgi:hypothetical protein